MTEYNDERHAPFIWQTKQWLTLTQIVKHDKLPHALLLSGIEGMGKRSFAMAFAQMLLCQNTSSDNDRACGHCDGCRLFLANTHPDFYLLEPEGRNKVIKVDAIREMIAKSHQTSSHNEYKIFMIYPAECLHPSGANALLKTLEEPEGKTLFLLISHQVALLSATIRSRCQRIYFPPLEKNTSMYQDTVKWIQREYQPMESIDDLLDISQNAPMSTIKAYQAGFSKQPYEWGEQIKALLERKLSPLTMASEWKKYRIETLLTFFMHLLHDVIRYKSSLNDSMIQLTGSFAIVKKMSQCIDFCELFRLFDEVKQIKKELDSQVALNQQLMLERVSISLYEALGRSG